MVLSRPRKFQSYESLAKKRQAAFTLVEVMVGLVIIGLIAGSIIWGLNQLNSFATSSRLYTAAQTLAQNQIDLILTKGPFNPQLNPAQYPDPNYLQTGTYYIDPATPMTIYPTSQPVTIYTDPMTNTPGVIGTIGTTISDPGFTQNGKALNLRQAVVTVAYNFRGKNYSVVMNTMRTADQ